jgi:hypothetical protein
MDVRRSSVAAGPRDPRVVAGRRGVTSALGRPSRGLLVLALAALVAPATAQADPCLDAVVAFEAGGNGGFQADLLPDLVLGAPHGGGTSTQSLDVVSLGDGGTITVAFEDNEVVDGPGPDLTVFENVFISPGLGPFVEVGLVEASDDGVHFLPFPYDAGTLAGLAGRTPVLSHPDNGIDPRDPSVSGGDAYDLASVGLASATHLRITDPGATIADVGNNFPTPGPGKSGFDLDAVVAVHSVERCTSCCDADGDGNVLPNDVLLLLRAASELPTAVNPCGEAPCDERSCGDANDDRKLTAADVLLCLRQASSLSTPIALCATGDCDFAP